MKLLIYGWGNPGRADDGLAPALIKKLESWLAQTRINWVYLDSNYQLNIEDADNIQPFDAVIFADASQEQLPSYTLTQLQPAGKAEFSMHSVSAGYVLQLCQQLFAYSPQCYLLHLPGFSWDFEEKLSPKAQQVLEQAFNHLCQVLTTANKTGGANLIELMQNWAGASDV